MNIRDLKKSRIILTILLIVAIATSVAFVSAVGENVKITDPGFIAALEKVGYGPDSDGFYSEADLKEVTKLELGSETESLEELSNFTGIETLTIEGTKVQSVTGTVLVGNKKLKNLSVKGNPELTSFSIEKSNLSDLNKLEIIGNNHPSFIKANIKTDSFPSLKIVNITDNEAVKAVDISGEKSKGHLEEFTVGGAGLSKIICSKNKIEKLNIGTPDNITELDCTENNITSLPNMPNISKLYCSSNNIASLPSMPNISDLNCSNNSRITDISIKSNKLETLNYEGCKALENLSLEETALDGDVKLTSDKYPELKSVSLKNNNQIDGLILNNFENLNELIVNGNKTLSTLNYDGTKSLKKLSLTDSQVSEINLKHSVIKNLESLTLNRNSKLNTFNSSEKVSVYGTDKDGKLVKNTKYNDRTVTGTLDISDYGLSKLKDVSITGNKEITDINISNNSGLQNVDLSDNTGLKNIKCKNGNIKNLNVGDNNELTNLDASGNKLADAQLDESGGYKSGFNVTHTPNLDTLNVSKNDLTSLYLANHKELKKLDVSNNRLKDCEKSETGIKGSGLNIGSNENLEELNVSNNEIKSFDTLGIKEKKDLKKVNASGNKELSGEFKLGDENEKLKEIRLSGTAVESFETEFTTNNSALEKLDLSNTEELKNLKVEKTEKLKNIDPNQKVQIENIIKKIDEILEEVEEINNISDALKKESDESIKEALNEGKVKHEKLKNIASAQLAELEKGLSDENKVDETDDLKVKREAYKEKLDLMNSFKVDSGNNEGNLENAEITGTGLEHIDLSNNKLDVLKVSGNDLLKELNCSNNKLRELNIENESNKALKYLDCSENEKLELLRVRNNPQLQKLYCGKTRIRELDLTDAEALEILNCNDCKSLERLQVTDSDNLNTLNCNNTRLTSVDISEKADPEVSVNGKIRIQDGTPVRDVIGQGLIERIVPLNKEFKQGDDILLTGGYITDDSGELRFYFYPGKYKDKTPEKGEEGHRIIKYKYKPNNLIERIKPAWVTLEEKTADFEFSDGYKKCNARKVNSEGDIERVYTTDIESEFVKIINAEGKEEEKIQFTAIFGDKVFNQNRESIDKPDWVGSSYQLIVRDTIKPAAKDDVNKIVKLTDEETKDVTAASENEVRKDLDVLKDQAIDAINSAKTPNDVKEIIDNLKIDRAEAIKGLVKKGSGPDSGDGSGDGSGSDTGSGDGSGTDQREEEKNFDQEFSKDAYKFTKGPHFYTKYEDKNAVFETNGPGEDLMNIWITKGEVKPENYRRLYKDQDFFVNMTPSGGSEIIIMRKYMESLDDGQHVIKANYVNNKQARASFMVRGSKSEESQVPIDDEDNVENASRDGKNDAMGQEGGDKTTSSSGGEQSSVGGDKATNGKGSVTENATDSGVKTIRTGDPHHSKKYIVFAAFAVLGIIILTILKKKNNKKGK